jgi:hypothetical protein
MGYTKEDFDKMDKWDDILDRVASKVQRELPKHDVQAFKDEEPVEYRDSLRLGISQLAEKLEGVYTFYTANKAKGLSARECTLLAAFMGEPDVLEKNIKKLKFSLYMSEHKEEMAKNAITPEMILRAREYPFENLMQFNRQWKARCPFHNEQTASLSLNKKFNYIKCFGCGVKKDTIDYLMSTQKKSFAEAVKMLNHQ